MIDGIDITFSNYETYNVFHGLSCSTGTAAMELDCVCWHKRALDGSASRVTVRMQSGRAIQPLHLDEKSWFWSSRSMTKVTCPRACWDSCWLDVTFTKKKSVQADNSFEMMGSIKEHCSISIKEEVPCKKLYKETFEELIEKLDFACSQISCEPATVSLCVHLCVYACACACEYVCVFVGVYMSVRSCACACMWCVHVVCVPVYVCVFVLCVRACVCEWVRLKRCDCTPI